MAGDRTTYLLVDGENIDGTLGGNAILGRRPDPQERPRWNKVLDFATDQWSQPVRALFFINASRNVPTLFVQALQAMDYQPILLSGRDDESVVDIAIQRTLEALIDRPGDVILGSHDADFAPNITVLADGDRRLGLIVFTECVGQALREVPGVEIFDLESHAGAFDVPLPRIRIISIEEFDPEQFL